MANPIVIRVEIERMREYISSMLTEQALDISDGVQRALDDYMSDDNLRGLINKAVRDIVNHRVQDSVKHYFTWGEGGKALDAAVQAGLQATLANLLEK